MNAIKSLLILSLVAVLTVTLTVNAASDKKADGDKKSDKKLIEVEIELPKPIFVGTPTKFPPDVNIQDVPEGKRKPFMAPKETVNLAKDKPVTASEEPIIGDLEQITDGDKEGTDGSYVVAGFDKQWVQIDLEKVGEIYGIVLWHYHQNARVYRDVIVQGSNDPDFIEGVTILFNNDNDNSYGLGIGKDKEFFSEHWGKLMRTNGAKARYLRFHSNGSTADEQNHYIEIEVLGIPAK